MTPKDARFLAALREDEMRYRRRGRYESAVQSQRLAEIYESDPEEAAQNLYGWFDRGIDRVPAVLGFPANITGISLPNGLMYYLTEDVAFAVWAALGELLAVSREEFMASAGKRLGGGALMEFMHRATDTITWVHEHLNKEGL